MIQTEKEMNETKKIERLVALKKNKTLLIHLYIINIPTKVVILNSSSPQQIKLNFYSTNAS